MELWEDEDSEMIAVEVKGRDAKFTWEIASICIAPKEDMRDIERLATRTDSLGNSMKHSIIARDLNLPCVDWNGNVECASRGQPFINRAISETGYGQVVKSPTRRESLLDVYLVRQ
jgi:hypothetical protein